MANISSGGGGKKGQPQRVDLRVDFTPMVDMNMLLITFFMFCTTLSKPQTMDIVMPVPKDEVRQGNENQADAARTMTVILGSDDKIYYFEGKPNYEDPSSLLQTSFSPGKDGLRSILLKRNARAAKLVSEYRLDRAKEKMTQEEFDKKLIELAKADDAQTVVIKPTANSSYKNLVDVLDEMQICAIAKYAIVELDKGDYDLLVGKETFN